MTEYSYLPRPLVWLYHLTYFRKWCHVFTKSLIVLLIIPKIPIYSIGSGIRLLTVCWQFEVISDENSHVFLLNERPDYCSRLANAAPFTYVLCRFFLPMYKTLHLSTLNFICQSCDKLKSSFKSSCSFIESMTWLILPNTFVSSATFRYPSHWWILRRELVQVQILEVLHSAQIAMETGIH